MAEGQHVPQYGRSPTEITIPIIQHYTGILDVVVPALERFLDYVEHPPAQPDHVCSPPATDCDVTCSNYAWVQRDLRTTRAHLKALKQRGDLS